MRAITPKPLRFPMRGYTDALDGAQTGGSYYTPAAVNVVGVVPYSPRYRGGTRPGLHSVSTATFSNPRGVWAIPWKTEDGVLMTTIAVVDGQTIKVVSGETPQSTVGYASTENGEYIVTEGSDRIVFSQAATDIKVTGVTTASACVFESRLYFLSGNGVKSFDLRTGVTQEVIADAYGSTDICVYRGRLILFGGDNVVHAMGMLNPNDADVGKHYEDVSMANSFTLSLAGERGDRVTAFIPCSDAVAIIATRNSLWKLDGDPNTGSMKQISREIGIVSSKAWAKSGVTDVMFLSEDGAHFVNPFSGEIEPLNRTDDSGSRRDVFALTRINTDVADYVVSYDRNVRGYVVLAITGGTSADDAWIIDERHAVWPISFDASKKPVCIGRNTDTDSVVDSYLVCKDGRIRTFSWAGTSDDGSAIKSAVTIGPVFGDTAGTVDSILAEIICEFSKTDTASEGVVVEVFGGRTAFDVVSRSESFVEWAKFQEGDKPRSDAEFSFRGGWNNVVRPRVRGNAFTLVVWSSTRWCYSGITSVSRALGRIR